MLHNTLRTTSSQVGEARRTVEALQEKLKTQQVTRQKIVNLKKASAEEEHRLLDIERRHGLLDVGCENAWELQLQSVMDGVAQQSTTGAPVANTLAATLPSAAVLRARLNALRERKELTRQKALAAQARSTDKELKYRHLVSLFIRRPEPEVDSYVEGLTRAVESEKGELDIARVRRFLGGVEGVVH